MEEKDTADMRRRGKVKDKGKKKRSTGVSVTGSTGIK